MLNCFRRVLKRSLSAHLMQVKLLLFTFIWMADCMQFMSENHLNGCQIFGLFIFKRPHPNQISVIRTSLCTSLQVKSPVEALESLFCNVSVLQCADRFISARRQHPTEPGLKLQWRRWHVYVGTVGVGTWRRRSTTWTCSQWRLKYVFSADVWQCQAISAGQWCRPWHAARSVPSFLSVVQHCWSLTID